MVGQDTWDNAFGHDQTDDTLKKIDVASGAVTAVTAPARAPRKRRLMLAGGDHRLSAPRQG